MIRAKAAFFAAILLLTFSLVSWGAAPKIEKIILQGNERLTQDAFLALTSLRPGESYDEERVHAEYQKIWKSGLFEDLVVESVDGEEGVILTFRMRERPIVASVEYAGSKKLTSSTNLDKLKENDADMKTGVVLDYNRVKRTESALRFIAAEKGFPDATVRSEIRSVGRSQVAVIFTVLQGPKTRIDKVYFTGNEAFSDRRLRWVMKKTRSHWVFSPITRHDIYSESRYFEDIKAVRELYEGWGYLDVDIGDPVVGSRLNSKGTRKWLTITIPVVEGVAYNLGDVNFEGNTLFTDEELEERFPFKKGKPVDKTLMTRIMKAYEAMYGEKGYIYATATPIFDRSSETRIANVTISITEDEKYFVNRIEFEGNTSTRDHVLRRELLVHEREVFNYRRYQRGLYRLKQLGIFEVKEDPVIKKVPGTRTVDIHVKGSEASRNEVLFGGGYGGINGMFVSGSFRTYNFMGLGSTLSLNADMGKVQKLYTINYSDPWLFGRRIGGSFSLYNSDLEYLQWDQRSSGGSFVITFPIGDFSGWQVGYRYEESKVEDLSTLYGYTSYTSRYLASTVTSSAFGAVFYNTVNNPFRPTRGLSLNLSATYAGGPLGGDNDFIKPLFEGMYYYPTFRRQNFAFRVNSGYVKPLNGQQIPPWERFFLGGENSLRGFGIRSVYPLTKDQRFFLDNETYAIEGGDRFFLANVEYVFHVVEQVDVALFVDIGNTYHERQKFDLTNYRANAGVEVRFYIPMFQVPLRLIYANNIKKYDDDDFSTFQFAISLTF